MAESFEILHRGKRTGTGEWVEGLITHDIDGTLSSMETFGGWGNSSFFDVDPETVGVYINWRDKNKTRIFSGDILRYFDDEIQVVEWDDIFGLFVLHTYAKYEKTRGRKKYVEFQEGLHYFNDYPIDCMEIIGNIFDNPDIIANYRKAIKG